MKKFEDVPDCFKISKGLHSIYSKRMDDGYQTPTPTPWSFEANQPRGLTLHVTYTIVSSVDAPVLVFPLPFPNCRTSGKTFVLSPGNEFFF